MTDKKIQIKLTPKASRSFIRGWDIDVHGQKVLKVCVTAVPEKGKANKALIALLSKSWRIPKSSIEIIRGETDKLKLIVLDVSDDVYKEIVSD